MISREDRGPSEVVPRILISPSSPDQNQQLYTTSTLPTTTSRARSPKEQQSSPKLPGSLSMDSPTPSSSSTSTSHTPRSPSQTQSFFASLASSITPNALSTSISSLMLLPSKLTGSGTGGGIKLTKVSSEEGKTRRGATTKSVREEEDEEESESSTGEEVGDEESESGSEEHDEEEERRYDVPINKETASKGGTGEIGRQSMDLRLEEATTGPTSVQDTPSVPSPDPNHLPPSLHRTPSTAFRQASQQGVVHPLTLQAIRRQDSEREALILVEEMGAEFKRRDTRGDGNERQEAGQGEMGPVLGRIRSESPTQMGEEEEAEVNRVRSVEREREDSQSTVKGSAGPRISRTTPPNHSASPSTSSLGKGTPPNISSIDQDRSFSTSSAISTSTTTGKTKKSFFSRFKKDKSSKVSPPPPPSSMNKEFDTSSTSNTSSSVASSGLKRGGSSKSKSAKLDDSKPPLSTRSSGFGGTEGGGGGGGGGGEGGKAGKIRHPKVKTKGKSRKDFNKLFLAQELRLSSVPPTSRPVGETSSLYSQDRPSSLHSTSPTHEDSSSLEHDHSTSTQTSEHKKERSTNSTAGGSAGTGDSKSSKQNRAVWAVKFSNNGKWLAVGGRDGVVRVWEVLSTREERETIQQQGLGVGGAMPIFKEKPIREYKGHGSDVLDLNWSKNDFLLSSSMDKTVRLWHIDRDECLCSFEHLDFVTSIAFHPKDDRFFLSGSLDCKLRLWNIVEKRVQVWTELPELITAVSFTRDGAYAIAGSFIGQCMFFEVETFRFHNIFTAKSSKRKDQKGKKITSLVMFPLGAFNADGETDGEDTDQNCEPDDWKGKGRGDASDRLLVTSNDSHMRLYNTKGRFVEAKYSGHENTSSQIRASFSDDGKYVISGSEDRHVYIWDSGVVRNSYGEFDVTKKRSEGAGFESFSMSAHIVTAALFAPTTTRAHLAKSGDPIFSNGDLYPHLDPLPRSTTRSSMGAASEKSEHKKGSSASTAADDMIVVVADAETGVISIFRNSRIPPSVLSPTSSAPPSAAGSIFRHNNYHQHAASSTSMGNIQEKRYSRASATSH